MFSKPRECDGGCSPGGKLWYPARIYGVQPGLFLIPSEGRCVTLIGNWAVPGDTMGTVRPGSDPSSKNSQGGLLQESCSNAQSWSPVTVPGCLTLSLFVGTGSHLVQCDPKWKRGPLAHLPWGLAQTVAPIPRLHGVFAGPSPPVADSSCARQVSAA